MATVTASGRRALILVSLLLVALSGTPLGAEPQQAGGTAPRVAIVLGNGPTATDEPTSAQTARCLKGFELYKNGTVNKLLVTGGFTRDYISEARMMKIALVTFGVPPDDILEEQMASSTVENGIFSARMFEERGWQKTAVIVSQAYHLPRADGIFKGNAFQVQDGTAADAAAAIEDFALVPGMKGDAGVTAEPSDLVVVYEPYSSIEPMDWPTPQLARRLRVAAALYHKRIAPTIVLYNDRYTRGPVNIAQMMKIAMMSLGVPAASIKVIGRGEYRWLTELATAYKDKSATFLTAGTAAGALAPAAAPKWKVVLID
jgi:vancomycin permeability regulator SanA